MVKLKNTAKKLSINAHWFKHFFAGMHNISLLTHPAQTISMFVMVHATRLKSKGLSILFFAKINLLDLEASQ